MEDIGIFGMIDFALADELGVDVDTYNYVMENGCTYWETVFIVTVFMDQRFDKMDKAREIFHNRLNGTARNHSKDTEGKDTPSLQGV
jgi:hypothetical protein